MPTIDRNANSANRQRRNWQRASQGALTGTIQTSVPLTGGSTIGLGYDTATGLGLIASTLAILFADSTITSSVSGIRVNAIAESQVTGLVSDLAARMYASTHLTTTAPLAGGGNLSTGLTLSLPVASSTTNGYLSSTDWTAFHTGGGSSGGGGIATSTLLGTTAPLAGGGALSTSLTLSLPQATSTANGYLSSTDWAGFNAKGSGVPVIAGDVSLLAGTSTGSTTLKVQYETPSTGFSGDFTSTAFNTSISTIGGASTTWRTSITNTTFYGVNTSAQNNALKVGGLTGFNHAVQPDSGLASGQIGAAVYIPTLTLPTTYSVIGNIVNAQTASGGNDAAVYLYARLNKATFATSEGVALKIWSDSIALVRMDTGAVYFTYAPSPALPSGTMFTAEIRFNGNVGAVLLDGVQIAGGLNIVNNSTNTGWGFGVGGKISSTDGFGGVNGVQLASLIDNTRGFAALVTSTNGIAVQPAYYSGLVASALGLALAPVDNSLVVASTGVRVRLSANGGLALNGGLADGLKVLPDPAGPLGVSSAGITATAADASISVAAAGLKVVFASSSGLTTSGGVFVNGDHVLASVPVPVDGDHWYNNTSNIFKHRKAGLIGSNPSIIGFGGPGTAIVNTSTAGNFGATVTLPANYLILNRAVRIEAWGNYVASGSSPSLTISGLIGAGGDGSTANLGASVAGRYTLDVTLTCTSTGASGRVNSGGSFMIETATGNIFTPLGLDNLSVNTTTTNAVTVNGQWSVASVSNSTNIRGYRMTVTG